MADPQKIFQEIVHAAVQEAWPATDKETIEKAYNKRLKALPPNVQDEIKRAGLEIASYQAPGFHEHGPH